MKKIAFGVLASFLLGGSVWAADLPVKAPIYKAPPVAVYNWTGFYLGGNVGWGLEHLDVTNVGTINSTNFPAGYSSSADLDGVLGGVQAGFDWQFNPNWLVGIGGDYDWSGIKGDSDNIGAVNSAVVSHIHRTTPWLATLTGRVGFVANDWLLYAKGGAAWARAKSDSYTTNAAGATTTTTTGEETRTGWTVGGGVEYRFAPHWSALLEYDYMDFGTETVSQLVTMGTSAPVLTGVTLLRDSTLHVNVVKAGVNFRF